MLKQAHRKRVIIERPTTEYSLFQGFSCIFYNFTTCSGKR